MYMQSSRGDKRCNLVVGTVGQLEMGSRGTNQLVKLYRLDLL